MAVGCSCLAACGGPVAPPQAPKAAVSVSSESPRDEANRLAAAGDYARAEAKYREALAAEPDDLLLHFGLGSVLSYLNKLAEATEQFKWVVEHGRPSQPEVVAARQWLGSSGGTAAASATETPVRGEAAPQTPASRERTDTKSGSLRGKTQWPGQTGPDRILDISVTRYVDKYVYPTLGSHRGAAQVRVGDSYAIGDLPPGSYRLFAKSGGVSIWDTRVDIEPGKETSFDLTPSNSRISPDEPLLPPRVGQ